ncbi:MAG: hypothetical protein HQL46_02030 [Gammaproteobacteria bacterium]|nr:hypothetical protein [Gammaproteobacteria bacterium]
MRLALTIFPLLFVISLTADSNEKIKKIQEEYYSHAISQLNKLAPIFQYMCTDENHVGHEYSESSGKWEVTQFNNKRYIVSLYYEKYGSYSATVNFFRTKSPQYLCIYDRSKETVICQNSHGEFKFNRNNLRFLQAYTQGYINDEQSMIGTPSISIGTCTEL